MTGRTPLPDIVSFEPDESDGFAGLDHAPTATSTKKKQILVRRAPQNTAGSRFSLRRPGSPSRRCWNGRLLESSRMPNRPNAKPPAALIVPSEDAVCGFPCFLILSD